MKVLEKPIENIGVVNIPAVIVFGWCIRTNDGLTQLTEDVIFVLNENTMGLTPCMGMRASCLLRSLVPHRLQELQTSVPTTLLLSGQFLRRLVQLHLLHDTGLLGGLDCF